MAPLLFLTGAAIAMIAQGRGETMRRRIVGLASEEPGIHLARAARILGIGASTLDFHVRKLIASDAVQAVPLGKTVHLFPADAAIEDVSWRIAMGGPEAQAIAAFIQGEPLGIQQVSQRLGLSRKVVRRQMYQMAQAGLLEREAGHHGKFMASEFLMGVLSGTQDLGGTHKHPRLPEWPATPDERY